MPKVDIKTVISWSISTLSMKNRARVTEHKGNRDKNETEHPYRALGSLVSSDEEGGTIRFDNEAFNESHLSFVLQVALFGGIG